MVRPRRGRADGPLGLLLEVPHRRLGGAGLYVGSSPCGLFSCEFRNNAATANGGGVQTGSSIGSPVADLANCTFVGNTAAAGTEQIGDGSSGQVTASYSDIGPGSQHAGTIGNIGVDPQFVDADGADDTIGTRDDDLRLQAGSPCIDAADGDAAPETDIACLARHDDLATTDTGTGDPSCADMGAREYQGSLGDAPPGIGGGCGGSPGAVAPCLLILLVLGTHRRRHAVAARAGL